MADKQPMPKVDPMMAIDTMQGIYMMLSKPGSQTSERRDKIFVQILAIAVAGVNSIFNLGLAFDLDTAMILIGSLEGLYTVGRSVTKAKNAGAIAAVAKASIESPSTNGAPHAPTT